MPDKFLHENFMSRGYKIHTVMIRRVEAEKATAGLRPLLQSLHENNTIDEYFHHCIHPIPLDTMLMLLTASHKVAQKLPGEVVATTIGRKTPLRSYDFNNLAITITKKIDNGKIYHVVLGLTLVVEEVRMIDMKTAMVETVERVWTRYWAEAIARVEDDIPVEKLATKAALILAQAMGV